MTSRQFRTLSFVACLVFFGLFSSAATAQPAQAQASRTYYAYCYSEPLQLTTGGPMTRYFSTVFATPDFRVAIMPPSADPLTRGRPDGGLLAPGRTAWAKEFNEFLVQKYSLPTSIPVSCEAENTEQQARDRLANLVQDERNYKRAVIDTSWRYSYTAGQPIPGAVPCYTPPAQHTFPRPLPGCTADGHLEPAPATAAAPPRAPAPPAAAAPPATRPAATPPPRAASGAAAPAPRGVARPPAPPVARPAPEQKYALCFARMFTPKQTAYFSAPFGPAKVANRVWQEAFKDLLVSQYHFAGQVGCITEKTEAEVQAYEQRTKDGMRSGGKWTIVDTGWKFQ
jgi:hypothetical protein